MPVRQIPKNFRSLTGRFSSGKNSRGIAFESSLERDLAVMMEFEPRILEFEEQPLHIPFRGPDGKPHIYTPDFRVAYREWNPEDGPIQKCLVEVKYREDLRKDWAILRPSFKAAVAFAAARGWHFKILTEREIRPRCFKTVSFLVPFLREDPDPEMEAAILEAVRNHRSYTKPKIMDLTTPLQSWAWGRVLRSLWRMVAVGALRTHYLEPMTMSRQVWVRPEDSGRYLILDLPLPGLYR